MGVGRIAMEGTERPALRFEHTHGARQHEMGERCTDDLGLASWSVRPQ